MDMTWKIHEALKGYPIGLAIPTLLHVLFEITSEAMDEHRETKASREKITQQIKKDIDRYAVHAETIADSERTELNFQPVPFSPAP
jgi:hypothetical protein